MNQRLRFILAEFQIEGELISLEPLGEGHINQTYVSRWQGSETDTGFVHQRINTDVFTRPDQVMENIGRVTEFLRKRVFPYSVLEIIPTQSGDLYYEDKDGAVWRTYRLIEPSVTAAVCRDIAMASQAGIAVGRFHQEMASFPTDSLHVPIPGFLDMDARFDALETAVKDDACGRVDQATTELAYLSSAKKDVVQYCEVLKETTSLRPIHGDAKLNNILFDEAGERALGLVDLDTCMDGDIMYDFGDLLRSVAPLGREDEQDIDAVTLNPDFLSAVVRGYLQGLGSSLSEAERALLPLAPRIVTVTLAARFLTDYLVGDTYFKVTRPEQNIERCRVQCLIARLFGEREDELSCLLKLSL